MKTLLDSSDEVVDITQKQVSFILSIQDTVELENKRDWKINNKKKRCGKLDINKILEKHFEKVNINN